MKYANKLEIPYVIVIGDDEIQSGKIKVKNMQTGEEVESLIKASDISKIIKNQMCVKYI